MDPAHSPLLRLRSLPQACFPPARGTSPSDVLPVPSLRGSLSSHLSRLHFARFRSNSHSARVCQGSSRVFYCRKSETQSLSTCSGAMTTDLLSGSRPSLSWKAPLTVLVDRQCIEQELKSHPQPKQQPTGCGCVQEGSFRANRCKVLQGPLSLAPSRPKRPEPQQFYVHNASAIRNNI